MKKFASFLIVMTLMVIGSSFIGGCVGSDLSPEKKKELDELYAANEKLAKETKSLFDRVKAGELPLADFMALTVQLSAQSEKNVKAINAIIEDAKSAAAATGGVVGFLTNFGRSALHLATKLPFLPSWAGALLGLLLGGSSTERKVVVANTNAIPTATS